MKEEIIGVDRFYARCAELLGAEHTFKAFPYRRRTRWNNRTAGNGRFEGFGLIRLFGDSVHMALHHPESINRFFVTQQDALTFLEQLSTKFG